MDSIMPESHGFRLLPSIVDHYTVTDPSKIHSYIYPSNVLQNEIVAISYRELACAIDNAARWLIDDVGVANQNIAFLGCSDLRSVVFFLASMKAGCKVCGHDHEGVILRDSLTQARYLC
jgi:long-subunit acyl-CoA synthetase (AMP-forming)